MPIYNGAVLLRVLNEVDVEHFSRKPLWPTAHEMCLQALSDIIGETVISPHTVSESLRHRRPEPRVKIVRGEITRRRYSKRVRLGHLATP